MKNNCYDIERVYFSMDQARKGHFNRFDLKLYLVEQGTRMATLHEHELDLLMSFFDRSGQGRVKFEEFVSEFH